MTDVRTRRPTSLPGPGEPQPPVDGLARTDGRSARRLRHWWVRPVVLYGGSRAMVALVAVCVGRWDAAHGTNPHAGPWPPLGEAVSAAAAVLGRWDAAWYRHLAVHGYPGPGDLPGSQRSLAFFPLFPGLVRAVSLATPLTPLGAGIAVSVAAGGLGVLLAWRLVSEVSGAAAADRAAAVLCFFPGSVVLSMAYSEGLLLAAAAGTMLALLRHRWVLAGCVGAVATLSRPNGVAVVAMATVAAVSAIRSGSGRAPMRWFPLVAPTVAACGVLGFFAYLAVRTGWPLAWSRAQSSGWHDSLGTSPAPLSHLRAVWHGRAFGSRSGQLNPVVGVVGLAVIAWWGHLLARWRPPGPLVAYTVVSVALALSSARVGARPRMVLAAFPLLLAAGVEITGRAHRWLVASMALLSCVVAILFLHSLAMTP